jgi:hypothetical protein
MQWSDVSRELDESPRAIPQPRLTPFDDATANRKFAAKTLAREVEVIESTPDYRIVRTGDGHRGWLMLYNEQQHTADYVVQYASRRWPFLNTRTITQVIIWRDLLSQHTRGLTRRMFFDYLLDRHGAIMSDLEQTPQGNDFWRARIADAVAMKLRVGIVYMKQKRVDWFDPTAGQSVRQWLGSPQETFDTRINHPFDHARPVARRRLAKDRHARIPNRSYTV